MLLFPYLTLPLSLLSLRLLLICFDFRFNSFFSLLSVLQLWNIKLYGKQDLSVMIKRHNDAKTYGVRSWSRRMEKWKPTISVQTKCRIKFICICTQYLCIWVEYASCVDVQITLYVNVSVCKQIIESNMGFLYYFRKKDRQTYVLPWKQLNKETCNQWFIYYLKQKQQQQLIHWLDNKYCWIRKRNGTVPM